MNTPTKRREPPACVHCGEPAVTIHGAHTSLIERLTQHGITVRIPGEEADHVD